MSPARARSNGDALSVGNDGAGRAQHGDDQRGEVELTLVGGAHDAGDDLLGVGAAAGTITATDFAGDHGGTDGLFGAPVGGVDRRVPQEGEHGGEFAVQMGGEAVGGVQRRSVVDQLTELGEQSAASGCQAVVAQTPGVAAVAQLENGLQDGLHPGGPRAARMIGSELPPSPHQVSRIGLVQRVGEAAIRRPPVTHEHAVVVGSQDRWGVVEPAAGADHVDRRLRCGEDSQPVAHGADALAGFIRRDHG